MQTQNFLKERACAASNYIPAPAPTWKAIVGTLGGILLGAVGLVVIGVKF